VREVGAGVGDLAPGDRVVTTFLMSCGHCDICDDGRPYLPAGLEDAAAASGALRGAGIPPPQDYSAVAEGFAAPADAVAAATTGPRGPSVRPFAAPNANANEAAVVAAAASSPASSSSPLPATAASSPAPATSSAAPAPGPSSAAASNSSSSKGKGFDCVAAALKLIAPTSGRPLCPTAELRESQGSLIARARCSMLVDQVLARPTPSGQW